MAAGTSMSRVLGMVRVVVLAGQSARPSPANAFTTANTLPNSLFLLIGGGVLNAVLVPQIVAAMRSADGGREYVDRLITLSLGLLAVATLVVTAAAPLLLRLFGSSTWSTAQVALGVAFAFWCLPQVFFYGLYTVLGQVLNARGSFGPTCGRPCQQRRRHRRDDRLRRACTAAATRPARMVDPRRDRGPRRHDHARGGRAGARPGAGAAPDGLPVASAPRLPWRRPPLGRRRSRCGRSAPSLVGQLGFIVLSGDRQPRGPGGRAAGTGRFVYDTAFLLFMLPHSLVTVSLVTALFTRMSHAVVAGRLDAVRADVSIALRTTGVATVLATVAFACSARTSPRCCSPRTPAHRGGLAWATTAMVLGLVPFSAMYLFQRVFYAFGDARTPFGPGPRHRPLDRRERPGRRPAVGGRRGRRHRARHEPFQPGRGRGPGRAHPATIGGSTPPGSCRPTCAALVAAARGRAGLDGVGHDAPLRR